MEENKIMLLLQLVSRSSETFINFERAFNNSYKEEFDSARNSLLDLHKKINFLLRNN